MFCMSYVACHLSLNVTLTLTATLTNLPLLTPPLCTVGWFKKTKKNTQKKQTIIVRAKTRKHLEVWPILAKIDRQTGKEQRDL